MFIYISYQKLTVRKSQFRSKTAEIDERVLLFISSTRHL